MISDMEPKIDEQMHEVKDEETNDLNSNLKTVPDGGWGWFVTAAAFVVQFIILGVQNNLGLFHAAHLEHFKKSKLETGIVIFVFFSGFLSLSSYSHFNRKTLELHFSQLVPVWVL